VVLWEIGKMYIGCSSCRGVRWCCGKLVRFRLDVVRVEVLGIAVGNW